jgi:predicted phosphodiesterase
VSRIGVIGDVHAEDERLERALAEFRRRQVDAILCVGDVVDGAGNVGRSLDLLSAAGAHVVAGNHERWFLADEMRTLPHATLELETAHREVMLEWPSTIDFDTPRGGLRLAHGVGDDDMAELRPDTKGYALQAVTGLRELMLDPTVSYHVGGHTHERMVRVFQGLVAINAGTLEGPDATALVIDFEARRVTFLDVTGDDLPPRAELPLPDPAPIPPQ